MSGGSRSVDREGSDLAIFVDETTPQSAAVRTCLIAASLCAMLIPLLTLIAIAAAYLRFDNPYPNLAEL